MYLRLRIVIAAFTVCLCLTAVSAPHDHPPVPPLPPTPIAALAMMPIAQRTTDERAVLHQAVMAAQAEQDANVAAWIANAPPPPPPPPPTRVARAKAAAPAPAPAESTPPSPPPTGSGSATDEIAQYFGDIYGQAIAVATCESGLNPGAISPGGGNWGLFQINTVHKSDFEDYTGQSWSSGVLNAHYNAMYARKLYDGNGGWGPWSCKRVL